MSSIKGAMKRSTSRMQPLKSTKGSMHHIGTTPHKYRFEIFISYAEPIKLADQVCMVLERRNNVVATSSVKVQDGKAVFREALTMEVTLFGKQSKTKENGIKFDEKIAKLCMKKGASDGKSLGKIRLNLADYVKGPQGTVFADLELSNGSVAVTKIETQLLYSQNGKGKEKKEEEIYSEMGDDDAGMENDSVFGDDASDFGDLVDVNIRTSNDAELGSLVQPVVDEKLSGSDEGLQKPAKKLSGDRISRVPSKSEEDSDNVAAQKPADEEPQSFRKKYLSASASKKLIGRSSSRKVEGSSASRKKKTEELESRIKSLESENRKLKKVAHKYKLEAGTLRKEIDNLDNKSPRSSIRSGGFADGNNEDGKLRETVTMQRSLIEELQAQKEELQAKLDTRWDAHLGKRNSNSSTGSHESTKNLSAGEENQRLKDKVRELEIALEREPQFIAVVNELKVVKMSLALANMEKEQVLFAAKRKTSFTARTLDSPVTPG